MVKNVNILVICNILQQFHHILWILWILLHWIIVLRKGSRINIACQLFYRLPNIWTTDVVKCHSIHYVCMWSWIWRANEYALLIDTFQIDLRHVYYTQLLMTMRTLRSPFYFIETLMINILINLSNR